MLLLVFLKVYYLCLRLVVVLERKAYVYELDSLARLRVLDTPPNPKVTNLSEILHSTTLSRSLCSMHSHSKTIAASHKKAIDSGYVLLLQGVCTMSCGTDPCYLGLPSSDLAVGMPCNVCYLNAPSAPCLSVFKS